MSAYPDATEFGNSSQPQTVGEFFYRIRMKRPDPKKILWANLLRLMDYRYGGLALSRLAEDSKFGAATSTRLRKQETSVGIDILEGIARACSLEPWQLLVPNFDPAQPPTLAGKESAPPASRPPLPQGSEQLVALLHGMSPDGVQALVEVAKRLRSIEQTSKRSEQGTGTAKRAANG